MDFTLTILFQRVHLEYVSVGDTDQFSPDCIAALDAGFEAAKSRGRSIKALVICNPHNPLGRCYPRETLIMLLRLCSSKGIHLISDEIYALSVYNRCDRPSERFISVRSIDLTDIIDPAQVHILYGMSKVKLGGRGISRKNNRTNTQESGLRCMWIATRLCSIAKPGIY